MAEHSRRTFLRTASLGAAAAGTAAVLPAITSSADAEVPVAGPMHHGPFLAWVKDADAGEISVLVGEHEVVQRDRALARRLAAIAARASTG